MPRPIETILSLPRVRLIDKVPIVETQEYIRRFLQRAQYRTKLVRQAIRVSNDSAQQFSTDDQTLSVLLHEVSSAQYVVTERSKHVINGLLSGICADGRIFKGFENSIQPLCETSQNLRRASKLTTQLVDRTKEESLDLARELLIPLPVQDDMRRRGRLH